MVDKFRFWLIRLLAGKSPVVLNCRMGGKGKAWVNMRPGDHGLVCGNTITFSGQENAAFRIAAD